MPTSSFVYFDAHLDQFGPQSGGWGSPEQLEGMERLGGALRVFFCERDGQAPANPDIHLSEARNIRDNLMPPHMPASWQVGLDGNFRFHVEGMESAHNLPDYLRLLDAFEQWGVNGSNPIYHKNNPLGGCSKESGAGLTHLGLQVLVHMWRSGWWVDLAHMSQATIHELQVRWSYEQPARLCYTHGGIRHSEITDPLLTNGNLERCLDLPQALEVVRRDSGLVCLSPAKPFYNRLDGPFLEHIKLLGEASGWRGVGIGTDYGGILDEWRLPGCRTVGECFQTVADFLLSSGLGEDQVRNVVGLNAQRFFMR